MDTDVEENPLTKKDYSFVQTELEFQKQNIYDKA